MLFEVTYTAGPYEGKKWVSADDPEQAIAKVKAKVRKEMTLPMYSDTYKVTDSEPKTE